MNEQEFKHRIKHLALRVIELADELPRRRTVDVLDRQLVRSGTSVGANYRSTCGKSAAGVLAELAIVEEEAEATNCWLELLVEAKIVAETRVTRL